MSRDLHQLVTWHFLWFSLSLYPGDQLILASDVHNIALSILKWDATPLP